MRSWRYSKWEGEADDPLELEAIMDMLADLLIEGRQGIWFEDESGITFKDIQDILDAMEVLDQQGLLPEKYQGEEGMKKLIERLEEEGLHSSRAPETGLDAEGPGARQRENVARPASVHWQERRRPPRDAAAGHGHRDGLQHQALRVRRPLES